MATFSIKRASLRVARRFQSLYRAPSGTLLLNAPKYGSQTDVCMIILLVNVSRTKLFIPLTQTSPKNPPSRAYAHHKLPSAQLPKIRRILNHSLQRKIGIFGQWLNSINIVLEPHSLLEALCKLANPSRQPVLSQH